MMDLPQADGKEANYNEGDSSVSFAGNPEEALLQVLGQKNNNVDANLGNMFDALIAYHKTAEKKQSTITPSVFFSTFLRSLTKESVMILLATPLIFLVLTSLSAAV